MAYRIRGLDPAPFRHLYGLSDAELATRNVVRQIVRENPGSPCRVTLEDAQVGERVLLLNYEHLPVKSPYRSTHAIFIREGAGTAADYVDQIPLQLGRRLLSLRAFDDAGMMLDADVLEGAGLEARIAQFLADPAVAYLHAHNAKPGCFAARIDRA